MTATPPSLRTQLLAELGFLVSAAILVVSLTTLLLLTLAPQTSVWGFLALWAGSAAVLVAFGAVRLRRLLLRPLDQLGAHADRLAAGDVTAAPPALETRELVELRDRFQHMTAELLAARDQVVRTEKLAAIGQLAAGVAHEIRNPLGAISNYVGVLERRAAAGGGAANAEVLAALRGEIDRIDRTVRGLLDYARPRTGEAARSAPAEVLARTVAFLEAQGAFNGVTLVTDTPGPAPEVAVPSHALEQVLVNLLLNARDAAPGGRVVAGLRAVRWGEGDAAVPRAGEAPPPPARTPGARPRRRELPSGTAGTLLFVADDGPGVPEGDRERVFEPFVTTKPAGQGSGLGLAIVARTVLDGGGVVWVDRAREGGAVFKVFLPAAGTA